MGLNSQKPYFASGFMKRTRKTYTFFQLTSAVVMILALLWLTVSTPFVNAAQQESAKQNKAAWSNIMGAEEENSNNALGNSTEEKKPSGGNSLSEEYLHHHHIDDNFISTVSRTHQCENFDVYNAFHGEVQVPPPNVA